MATTPYILRGVVGAMVVSSVVTARQFHLVGPDLAESRGSKRRPRVTGAGIDMALGELSRMTARYRLPRLDAPWRGVGAQAGLTPSSPGFAPRWHGRCRALTGAGIPPGRRWQAPHLRRARGTGRAFPDPLAPSGPGPLRPAPGTASPRGRRCAAARAAPPPARMA